MAAVVKMHDPVTHRDEYKWTIVDQQKFDQNTREVERSWNKFSNATKCGLVGAALLITGIICLATGSYGLGGGAAAAGVVASIAACYFSCKKRN